MPTTVGGQALFSELDRRVFETRAALGYVQPADQAWVKGYLGDPGAPIWFVSESSSDLQVRRVIARLARENQAPTPEHQWWMSPGDELFRTALVEAGFKVGEPCASGGWACYVTDFMKDGWTVKQFRALTPSQQDARAQAWARVLTFELRSGQPKLIVFMRRNLRRWFDAHVPRDVRARVKTATIWHYTYPARFRRHRDAYVASVSALRSLL